MSTDPEEPSDTEPDESAPRPDLDAAFDAIVANLRHGERPTDVPRWPANEDDEPAAPAPADPVLGSQWSGWDDLIVPEPEEAEPVDDEHYVPPPPPPVPKGDKVARWGWAGALGAPLLAVLLTVVGWDLSGLTGFLLVGAFLGGFATLVYRMREGPPVEQGPDDGAVV
jgi:hypothetical protein